MFVDINPGFRESDDESSQTVLANATESESDKPIKPFNITNQNDSSKTPNQTEIHALERPTSPPHFKAFNETSEPLLFNKIYPLNMDAMTFKKEDDHMTFKHKDNQSSRQSMRDTEKLMSNRKLLMNS